jgi:predicted ATPase
MRDLPSGIVTFLFTDVEGSTRLLHELGAEGYAGVLAEHRRVIREACVSEGGVEVDTQGDAFFFAFPSASGAVAAAAAFTEALASGPIRVRVGLHTGEPLLGEEGYVGEDVHFAARVAATGHGGQVVLSEATAELVEHPLVSLGSHRLKDVAVPVAIFQLGEGAFPPLKTIANSNLPTPASSFLGREGELFEADVLLQRTRLLTVSGPGGAGKTRFALELARLAREERFADYPDGVFSCFLSSLWDPGLVLPTIAQTLSVVEQPGLSALEALASHLEGKRMLLLLDNLEHLLEAASELSELLERASGLTLLVTSRELLRIRGETTYALPPLPVEESVALFCERAQTEPSEPIRELCARLEGLPLALELAAARLRILTAEQLLERLSQRLDLLKGGRDADPRQQTLRATIEWSYDLLTPEERQLFPRLSVFAGGCTLDAAEEVAGADVDALQSLVDKSLLRFTDGRYWMLETIREYAEGRLEHAGEAEELGDRHARAFAATSAALAWPARYERGVEGELLAEQANVRVALSRALDRHEVSLAGDCLFGLWLHWTRRGSGGEALPAAEAWLALERSALDPVERVPGLVACGEILRFLGDLGSAAAVKYEELEISRAHPDAVVHGRALGSDIAYLLSDLTSIQAGLGNLAVARRHSEEALAIWRGQDDPLGLVHTLGHSAQVALAEGDVVRARELAEEGLAVSLGSPDVFGVDIFHGYALLAECELLAQDFEGASELVRSALQHARGVMSASIPADGMRLAAMLATARGAYAVAAQLAGAFARQLRETGFVLSNDPSWARSYEELEGRLREALGTDYEIELERGARLGVEEALDLAEQVAQMTPFTASPGPDLDDQVLASGK